jgi:hypothetical protein
LSFGVGASHSAEADVRVIKFYAEFRDLLILWGGDVDGLLVVVDVEVSAVGEQCAILPLSVRSFDFGAAVNGVNYDALGSGCLAGLSVIDGALSETFVAGDEDDFEVVGTAGPLEVFGSLFDYPAAIFLSAVCFECEQEYCEILSRSVVSETIILI